MKKWVRRIIVTAVLLVASVSIILFGYNKLYNDKQPEGDIIVKENVKVITSETDNIPIDVREDYLVFGEKPEYKKGDVIVSGITENSLEGYIRRVLKVDKKNNLYIVKTEPAVLTDVFEKAHIYKKIELTEDGSQSVSYKTESMKGEKKREAFNIEVCKDEKEKKEEKEDKVIDENDNGTDYVIGKKFEEKDEPVTVSGEAGISIWVEIDIDINHGNIKCGIAAKSKEGAKTAMECSESSSKELEKKLLEKKLPNYEFSVAGIPIVVTNNLEIAIGSEMNLEGNIGASYEMTSETTLGFQYNSKTGKVKEIKKIDFDSDGLQWNTISVSGDASIGPSVHLITKLYGSSGLDMSVGILGKVKGEAKVSTKKELDGYAGSLDLSIDPEIQGTLVVDTPVVDKNLLKQPLFEVKLNSLWSKHWESSANWKDDLEWTEADEIEEAKEQVKTSYSNEYFEVEVPESWEGYWSVIEEDNTNNGIKSTVYHFTYNPEGPDNGGASDVYVIDMSDTSRPTQKDNRKAKVIKEKISNVLMMGRSRHCFVWCVQQRISASLFPTGIGAIDNFQICIGMGRLSVESRKSLFSGEHLEDREYEERYHPKTGQGLILIDGQEIQPIQIPFISDKERLKKLLQEMAKR